MSEQCKYNAVGCIQHFEGITTNRTDGVTLKFRVHFKDVKDIYKHAVESMCRVVAQGHRGKKKLPVRDANAVDQYVDIYSDGSLIESVEDYKRKLSMMTPEELAQQAVLAQAVLDAQKRAHDAVNAPAKK